MMFTKPIDLQVVEWRDRGSFFKWRDFQIFYRDEGKGPPLLLLHGFPTSSWDWRKLWPTWARSFRVMAVDFLGFGFSNKPRFHPYSLIEQADLIEYFVRVHGVPEIRILAHDYGVSVAQELMARAYESGRLKFKINSVVFLNGGLFPECHRPFMVQKLLASPMGPFLSPLITESLFLRSLRATFAIHHGLQDGDLKGYWQILNVDDGRRVLHRLIGYLQERWRHRERWVGAMQTPLIPKLFIVGGEDSISGSQMATRYRELVPNPIIELLPNVGHYPQLESPELVSAALARNGW
ncbi:MAG: alpha/beta hydrolase [Bdellovibrio sp.]|nr:MAG: alpha/beta hydrolase [Bdellovibrio sp.]